MSTDVDARAVVVATARAYLWSFDPDDTLTTRLRRALCAARVPLVEYPSVSAARRMAEAVRRAEEATAAEAFPPGDPDAVEAFLARLADEVVSSCVAASGR